jgi:hypothetical protein
MLNRLPQQDAREYLEGQARAEHERCKTEENTALGHALSAGDLLLAIIEKYRKRDYGGKTALYERTCGAARTGRQYIFLAKHRDLLEGKTGIGYADFSGHSIASALEYIRERKRTHKPKKPKTESAISIERDVQVQERDDAGADSCSESDRLNARIEEQEREIQQLQDLVARLESRLEEDPTPIQLQAQIKKLGLDRFREEVLPPAWIKPLTDMTVEKLMETIERKIPFSNRVVRKHLRTLKAAIDPSSTIKGTCEVVVVGRPIPAVSTSERVNPPSIDQDVVEAAGSITRARREQDRNPQGRRILHSETESESEWTMTGTSSLFPTQH